MGREKAAGEKKTVTLRGTGKLNLIKKVSGPGHPESGRPAGLLRMRSSVPGSGLKRLVPAHLWAWGFLTRWRPRKAGAPGRQSPGTVSLGGESGVGAWSLPVKCSEPDSLPSLGPAASGPGAPRRLSSQHSGRRQWWNSQRKNKWVSGKILKNCSDEILPFNPCRKPKTQGKCVFF